MNGWEAIPKENGKRRACSPYPRLTAYSAQGRSVRFALNRAALLLVPDEVVFLRNGDRLALRAACDDDLAYTVRKVSRGCRAVSATSIATKGQVFTLIPDGDLFLLEEVTD